jgi:glycosyltransferase involved in cell wall biosynthesis
METERRWGHTLAVLVITLNEADNISDCIDSVHGVDEVIVVDSGSTDGTPAVARRHGATVVEKPWSGFSDQRNYAAGLATSEWLMYLDADERLAPGTLNELRDAIDGRPDGTCAFAVDSLEYFLGSFLRHGGFGKGQTNWKVRVWKRGAGSFEGSVHERLALTEGRAERLQRVWVEHYGSSSTVSGAVDKANTYSSMRADESGSSGSVLRLFSAPLRNFITRFCRQSGWRDGTRGLLAALVTSLQELLVQAKLLEQKVASRAPVESSTGPPPQQGVGHRRDEMGGGC